MTRARRIGLLLVAVTLSLGAGPARAETVRDLFNDANARYWKGDFEGARTLYHRIVEDYRIDNPEVYFNLANTYAKLDRLGSAVLYYKRALRFAASGDTRDAAAANLARVVQTLVARNRERIEENRMLFDESHGAWYALFHMLPAEVLAWLALATWIGLCAALLVRRLSRRQGLRKALQPTAVALLALALLFGGLFGGNAATRRAVVLGVVLHPDVKLRALRAADSPTVKLPEGLELRILGQPEEEWLRVQLSNGREGFVPAESVKEI